MDKIADLEEFLATNLGSDLEKLNEILNIYAKSEIRRPELIKRGTEIIDKNFLNVFIKKLYSKDTIQKKEEN